MCGPCNAFVQGYHGPYGLVLGLNRWLSHPGLTSNSFCYFLPIGTNQVPYSRITAVQFAAWNPNIDALCLNLYNADSNVICIG
jgi:hypothetical protein